MEMKKNVLLVLLFAFCFSGNAQKVTGYSPEELETWKTLGEGKGFVTHGQFLMEEVDGSKGFMILSPEKYKDVVLRYEVMTLNPATVLVALLNASDIGESNELTLNENSDNFGFWTKEAEDYMFGFRVMAHNTTPFIRKHPVPQDGNSGLGLSEKDVMHSGWRHTVECGKEGNRVWLKIDGDTLIDVNDQKPLDAGFIAIRVRGTANELGKSMIRHLEIKGDPVR